MLGDLTFTKSLIDAYDFDLSKFTNDLADIAQAIWVLKGYEGTSLAEFMRNLRHFKSIKVNKEGGADAKHNEVPNQAYDAAFDRVEDNIFVFGMGVNPKIDKFGLSPSGIALEFMYGGLDIKSNILITELTSALNEFLWFKAQHLALKRQGSYNPDKVNPVFNKFAQMFFAKFWKIHNA